MSGVTKRSGLLRSFVHLLVLGFLGSCLIINLLVLLALPMRPLFGGLWASVLLRLESGLLTCGAMAATAGFHYLLQRLEPFLDTQARGQACFLDALDAKYIDVAIVACAALSLFMELAIIRWQASVLEFFAYYKNFSLLACFAGLGLGYALATRDRIPLLTVIPLLAWQFGFMTIVRSAAGSHLQTNPFREQLTMGLATAGVYGALALYALLAVVFLLTALAFLPVGQLCGRLMERRNKLRAYGLNLLGSLIGVLLMVLAGFLWTPPLAWFAVCSLVILLFHSRERSALITGIVFTVVCTIILAWPVEPLWNRIYSPYQLLEIGRAEDTGLTLVRAAGHYYQRIYDLSDEDSTSRWRGVRSYYDFPYKAHSPLASVAVVGAGTGNDVAAALRAGAGRVDAIEIDPAILRIGKMDHPEKPYDDPRVHAFTNDARSFFRTTKRKYDLIVYGLLDSHTLLSQGSSVRLDSFVYTTEGLSEARERLNPDGMISLSFSVLSDELGRKIYLMMQQVFDGRPPACVEAEYDDSVIFLESNRKDWMLPHQLATNAGFADVTARYADPTLKADVPTDDWPFFYMPRRVYPLSYLVMVVQVLVLFLLMAWRLLAQPPRFGHLSFFFLGAGFMLIETKGITEMGLTFGNTWQVIGVVIAGILTMAFLGNCGVYWLSIKRPLVPYLFLWACLLLGWFVAGSGGFASTPVGRVETLSVLTGPLLFSGIVFSTLLSVKGQVSGIMAMNLLGAICGGLLEYNSMYFGFRSLYAIAMGCYILAFVSELLRQRKETVTSPDTAAPNGQP
jgi:hypothetical protein